MVLYGTYAAKRGPPFAQAWAQVRGATVERSMPASAASCACAERSSSSFRISVSTMPRYLPSKRSHECGGLYKNGLKHH